MLGWRAVISAPPRASAATGPEQKAGLSPIGELERIGDDARDEALPAEHE
jgi:hypothetical protein